MRIGVAATPEVAIPTLNWLLNSEHSLALVITQPDKPAGRGRLLQQSDVAEWAEQHGIKIVKPISPQELIGNIEDLDLVLTIGYGVLLPEDVLRLPKHGFLNLHFSLLPQYRGAAPAQRALLNGEEKTGVTVFELDKGMDTGPIYSQNTLTIQESWRSKELLEELAQLGITTVSQAFEMILSDKKPTAQSGESSIAPKISKSEAKVDFNEDSNRIINLIRAFTYEPGAWTIWKGEPFKVTSAKISQTRLSPPGVIVCSKGSVLVGTNDSAIELITVIPAGKKEMKAIDWARGARLIEGDVFA